MWGAGEWWGRLGGRDSPLKGSRRAGAGVGWGQDPSTPWAVTVGEASVCIAEKLGKFWPGSGRESSWYILWVLSPKALPTKQSLGGS